MGLFKRTKGANQTAADAMAEAAAMEQIAAMETGAGLAPDVPAMPDFGNQDMAAMRAHWAKVEKIAQHGVDAPAVIHSVTATGTPDVNGAIVHALAVTITPEGGEPYATTIEQSLLPYELEGLSEGRACMVKYDPDEPTAALLESW